MDDIAGWSEKILSSIELVGDVLKKSYLLPD